MESFLLQLLIIQFELFLFHLLTNVDCVATHYRFEMIVQATSPYTQKNMALWLVHITTNTGRSSGRVAISDSTMDIAARVISHSFSMMRSG